MTCPSALKRNGAKNELRSTLEELEYLTLGGLRKAVVEGDVKNGSVMSGQIAGMIKEELTCREVIENIVAEASKLLEKGACYE